MQLIHLSTDVRINDLGGKSVEPIDVPADHWLVVIRDQWGIYTNTNGTPDALVSSGTIKETA